MSSDVVCCSGMVVRDGCVVHWGRLMKGSARLYKIYTDNVCILFPYLTQL